MQVSRNPILLTTSNENLELEDEEKKDLEAEDEVQEVPVTKKKPQEEETKKIQRQITSFFFKK